MPSLIAAPQGAMRASASAERRSPGLAASIEESPNPCGRPAVRAIQVLGMFVKCSEAPSYDCSTRMGMTVGIILIVIALANDCFQA